MGQTKLKIFVEQKVNHDYPWGIWAMGWISMIKAFLWVFEDSRGIINHIGPTLIKIPIIKCTLFPILFIVLSIGTWNLRLWAKKGLVYLCAVDIILDFILLLGGYPVLEDMYTGNPISMLFFQVKDVFMSPVGSMAGSIFIIFLASKMGEYFGKTYPFKNK